MPRPASRKRGKPNTMKAADALIASPEFTALAKQAGKPGEKAAATQLSRSKAFTRFMHVVGLRRELKNGEKWILQAMQANNQQKQ
jgi:hypothetical protein